MTPNSLTWSKLLHILNTSSARTVISRQRVPGEVTTDASFAGFGWAGMGLYEYGAWPADWQEPKTRLPTQLSAKQ